MKYKVTPFGIFIFKGNKIIHSKLFEKNPKENAKILFSKEGIEKLIKKLKEEKKIEAEELREPVNLYELALNFGFVTDYKDFLNYMNSFFIEYTKLKMKTSYSIDKVISQVIDAIEELDKIINVLYERISELYGLYYPESLRKMKGVEKLVKFICESKKREESIGYDVDEREINLFKKFASKILQVIELRKELQRYIEEVIKEFAPNLYHVAGPLLSAKLISLAGGLKNLASLPSSTIQVLGAEKALFRHLRKGTKPPKHGIILQHPIFKGLKKEKRGRIARILSSKIAIAAKADFYTKKEIWEKLLEDIKSKVKK